jgi:hypothetical protein
MAVTASPIIPATVITAAIVALYTVPVNAVAQVRKVTVSNPTAAARTFSLWLTETGQPTDATTVLISAKVVAPGATQEVFTAEGHVLSAGASISASSDVAGMVIQASGVLVQ